MLWKCRVIEFVFFSVRPRHTFLTLTANTTKLDWKRGIQRNKVNARSCVKLPVYLTKVLLAQFKAFVEIYHEKLLSYN